MQTASSAPRKGALTRALSAPGTVNGLILLGAVLQVLFFILYLINGDVHVDEAMLVLNARSLAREGTDIFGQRMPVYFDTWLYGGQSSLATYLAAAFIRLFGNQIWIARLPLALTAFASLFALKGLVRLLFPGQYTVQNTVLLLTAIEPWRLYQSAWTLDCAYLPFVLLFALYFLVHAVEKPKARLLFYTLSMACFALGLYAYMAAAILIPVLLVILYLSLLIKKKMKFRYALWSVAVLAVCALPFLLLGLVQAGLLKDCNFLGLSITAMDSYARGNSTTIFGAAGSAGAVFQRAFSNLGGVLYNILVPDLMLLQSARYPTLSGNVSNYPFGHTVAGLLALAGLLLFLWPKKHRKADTDFAKTTTARVVIGSFLGAFLVYAIVVSYASNAMYRYAAFYPLLHILAAFGVCWLLESFSSPAVPRLLAGLAVVSLALTGFAFGNFATHNSALYGKSFEQALTAARDSGSSEILLVDSQDPYFRERESVFLRFYADDKINQMTPLEPELRARGGLSAGNPNVAPRLRPVTKDGSWRYVQVEENRDLTDDCYIFFGTVPQLDKTRQQEYAVKNYNDFCVTLVRKK